MTNPTIFRCVVAAGVLLAGCGGGEEPAQGRFELVATQAGELPALLGERGGCRFEAVGGQVELKEDSVYTAELRRRRTCPPEALGDSIGAADTTFVDPGEGRFVQEGDSLYFRFARGGIAGFGVLHGDTLVVEGTGQTLRYVRAP